MKKLTHLQVQIIAIKTILFIPLFATIVLSSPQNSVAAQPLTNQWVWPLDGNFVVLNRSQYGTVIENTAYSVRNLDLVSPRPEHITCFGVGWHRIYHAGVDLYLLDNNSQVITEDAPVRAVSNGLVVHADQFGENNSIIIQHSADSVWSVYWHLDNVVVHAGDTVSPGQVIGSVHKQAYTGRFPNNRPYGVDDSHDSHLHFEIRTFQDGGNIFPNYPDCNIQYAPGVGYTYNELPDKFGYVDPLAFLGAKINSPTTLSHRIYLPLLYKKPTCQEGQNLIFYNANFENGNAPPWWEIKSDVDHPYNMILSTPSFPSHQGQYGALMGVLHTTQRSDEELVQSIGIPTGTHWVELRQWVKISSNYSIGTNPGDQFMLSLKDAVTGQIIAEKVIDSGFTSFSNHVWVNYALLFVGHDLTDRSISVSYNALRSALNPSILEIDEVSLLTHCTPYTPYTEQQANLNEVIEVVQVNEP